jgi:recombination protein RecR
MLSSPLLEQLIEALRYLPGVGPKTAQRMAFQLLERGRENGKRLSEILLKAMHQIGHCSHCRTFSETAICAMCASPNRDSSILCIVETPVDVVAVEQMGAFKGLYFILMGHLSPLDGIGPEQIGMKELNHLLSKGIVKEIILATNPTIEGEATAHYIAENTKQYGVRVTRIAHGVPLGGELEFVDSGTLAHAFAGREMV